MYSEKGRFTIEVCLSPLFYPLFQKKDALVVVTDIFRASTSMVAAFENGVKSIIPVAEVSESEAYKKKGFIVAGERDGKKLDCADFGNSPSNFLSPHLKGQTIVMNTTNGTQAIDIAARGNNMVIIGAFINLDAVAHYCAKQNKDLLVLCAGWKNRFSMEDSLFAGALVNKLITDYPGLFSTTCDSAMACADLWNIAGHDPTEYLQKAAHTHRLHKMGLQEAIPYCLSMNLTEAVPLLKGFQLLAAKENTR